MATNTYVALAKITPSGSLTSIVMDSIPGTYTDLVLVGEYSKTAGSSARMFINNDTSSGLYSQTILYGNGTSVSTGRETNVSTFYLLDYLNPSTTSPNTTITHIQDYANTNKHKTIIERGGSSGTGTTISTGVWRNTNAITRIDISAGSGTFSAGTTFSLYGIAAQATPGTAKATGGTITYDSFGRVVHTFTSSGTFTPTAALTNVDYLVVAGGGGSGTTRGGGGGAGGLRSTVSATGGGGSLETPLTLSNGTAYTITVGAGGTGSASGSGLRGNNGSTSSIAGSGITTISSTGGGGGGGSSEIDGSTGGSGGGGRQNSASNGGFGIINQGYTGGGSATSAGAGGGGGAGAIGSSGTVTNNVGAGGAGVAVAITGTSTYYAGGGAGGGEDGRTASGGTGGGGNTATAGTANTGGGAGGPNTDTGSSPGFNGGSGIVIIRYQG